MENAKMLILNNKQNNNFKAVLNLKTSDPSLIRFYNLSNSRKSLALGIKQSEKIVKVPLNLVQDNCEFNLPKNINLSEKLFCAVVDVTNAFCPEIVLSGSLNSETENTTIESAFVTSKPEDTSVLYEEDDDEKIENLIDKNLEEDASAIYYDSCANCRYRKAFYDENCACSCKDTPKNPQNAPNFAQSDKFNETTTYETQFNSEAKNEETTCSSLTKKQNENSVSKDNNLRENEIKLDNLFNKSNEDNIVYYNKNNDLENEKKEDLENKENENLQEKESDEIIETDTFFEQIKPQLDTLFNKYSAEEILQQVIANSKWVKVNYDGGVNYYVLGLIYDDAGNNVEYIAYGMPSNDSTNAPEDLANYAQWLALENSTNLGYWIVYQDAKTGETIKVNFV